MTDNVTMLDKLFFFFLQNVHTYPLLSACSWASQALIMFLSHHSCLAVWSRLLWTAVPPLKQQLSFGPGSGGAVIHTHNASLSTTDQVQVLTRHTLPFRSASVPWLLSESESLVCDIVLFLILTLGGTRVGEREVRGEAVVKPYLQTLQQRLEGSCAARAGLALKCSHTDRKQKTTCICFTYRWLRSDSYLTILCTVCNYL